MQCGSTRPCPRQVHTGTATTLPSVSSLARRTYSTCSATIRPLKLRSQWSVNSAIFFARPLRRRRRRRHRRRRRRGRSCSWSCCESSFFEPRASSTTSSTWLSTRNAATPPASQQARLVGQAFAPDADALDRGVPLVLVSIRLQAARRRQARGRRRCRSSPASAFAVKQHLRPRSASQPEVWQDQHQGGCGGWWLLGVSFATDCQ